MLVVFTIHPPVLLNCKVIVVVFSKTAIMQMAQAVAVEARASYNMFLKEMDMGDHTCLSLFAPVINIMRHPLWGRNQVRC